MGELSRGLWPDQMSHWWQHEFHGPRVLVHFGRKSVSHRSPRRRLCL